MEKWTNPDWFAPFPRCLIYMGGCSLDSPRSIEPCGSLHLPLFRPEAVKAGILLHGQLLLWEKRLLTLYNNILRLTSPLSTNYFHNEEMEDLWILQNLQLTRRLWMAMHRWAGMSLIHYCTHATALFIINDTAYIFLSSGTE